MAKERQIVITDELWDTLGKLGHELEYGDPRGNRSQIIREMISATVTKWRESPYICRAARHVVLVTGKGDVFMRAVHLLKLNSRRERLPCLIEMKPEKRRDFRLTRDPSIEEADWLRSRWLVNHFAVWHGAGIDGRLLSEGIDRDGIDAKMADLPIGLGSGRLVTRETIVGLQDYVQWMTPDSSRAADPLFDNNDRIDIPIDIPTRKLEIFVMVDTELYHANAEREDELADLEVEFRNREGARFRGKGPLLDPENPGEVEPGRKLDDSPDPEATRVESEVRSMQERILSLCEKRGRGPLCCTEDEYRAVSLALKVPEHFLCCRVSWPSPYFGIEICVSWEKPLRP